MEKMVWIVVGFLVVASMSTTCSAANCADGTMKIDVGIIKPSSNEEIYINDASTFSSLLQAQNILGSTYQQRLTWTAAGFAFENDDYTGLQARIKLNGWPTSDSDIESVFGVQEVKLEYVNNSAVGDCDAKVNIRVFFDADGIVSGNPAWYKYWNVMGAVPTLSGFTLATSIVGSNFGANGPGKFDIVVSDFTLNPDYTIEYSIDSVFYLYTDVLNLAVIPTSLTGINKVGCVVGHEFGHEVYFNDVILIEAQGAWDEISLQTKQTNYNTQATAKAKFEAIITALRISLKNESETRALEENDNYDEYVETSKDWSKGGENDK